MIPIIDTHQHLWDLEKFALGWVRGSLAKSHLMSDYRREAQGLNIVKTIYMEVAVAPEQQAAEAEYVIDLCRRGDNPMAAAVIGGRPGTDGFKAYIARFAGDDCIKGVRQTLHGGTPKGTCLEPEFVRDIRLLGEKGLRFDLCLRADDLADGAALADLCPETSFILDHCGNADAQAKDLSSWRRGMDAIARRGNVVCKVSGIVASARPGAWNAEDLAPIVRHTAAAFGKDRVLFGSDWPVCTRAATLRQWVEALQHIVADWPEPERRALFHDNAARFYGIDE